MRTGSFLCLSPGFIVNSPLSAPPPPAFSHLLREGSSELSFCALKHPRFEHFPPLFRQNVPSFAHLSPLSTDNFPRSAETTPRFVENRPVGMQRPPDFCCLFPFARHRAPRRLAVLRASGKRRKRDFRIFCVRSDSPPACCGKYRTIRPRPHRFVPPLRQFCHLLSHCSEERTPPLHIRPPNAPKAPHSRAKDTNMRLVVRGMPQKLYICSKLYFSPWNLPRSKSPPTLAAALKATPKPPSKPLPRSKKGRPEPSPFWPIPNTPTTSTKPHPASYSSIAISYSTAPFRPHWFASTTPTKPSLVCFRSMNP